MKLNPEPPNTPSERTLNQVSRRLNKLCLPDSFQGEPLQKLIFDGWVLYVRKTGKKRARWVIVPVAKNFWEERFK